jgi:GT2 family glycosyltransferase
VRQHTHDVLYEIILIDNASTECDPEKFKQEFPEIILIKSEKNGGFAYGNNLGIEKAKGEFILLLNNDTIFQEDTTSKSLSYFQQQSNVGAIGSRMIHPDGKVQYTARRFRSISWELLDLFRFILYLMPYKKRAKQMLGKYFRHDCNVECDWINGAFFLFPKKILDQLPGRKLDDRFFMYGEDQLWCEQIKNLGFKILFFAESTIIHIGSGSAHVTSQLRLRKTMMKHELEIMRLRKGKGLYYFLFAAIYVSKESVRNFIKSIVLRLSGKMLR